MSREEFHRLIQTAEKKKKHRRTMLSLAAACVALCLVCGGFVAGMSMRESASAGKDDETKTVQQGSSEVIGSGVSEKDQNVGVSTKTYTNIEDIPEDIRKDIHFLDSDEFELEKVKVVEDETMKTIISYYKSSSDMEMIIKERINVSVQKCDLVIRNKKLWDNIDGCDIYTEESEQGIDTYLFVDDDIIVETVLKNVNSDKKIEAILNGLIH